MKIDDVSDNRLTVMWQKYLQKYYPSDPKTRSLKLCGSQIIKNQPAKPAVFVLTNGERSKFFGLTTCHSAWACPRCTAKMMAEKGARIAIAIDALAKWYNQQPLMMTLTLPHTKHMSCEETFQLLQDTWRLFTRAGNHKSRNKHYYTAKSGERREYRVGNDAYGDFRESLGIKHIVRVYEFTWGENSWHPHIHALIWCPKKNWNKIADFEERLMERWWNCAKFCALRMRNKKFPDTLEENKRRIEIFFADWRKIPKGRHRSLFISKTPEGKIYPVPSSYYISGWGGDNELTGLNYKKTSPGHYTPYMILVEAQKAKTPQEQKQWLDLYYEYAKATFKHRRVEWSKRDGLTEIINRWKQTEDYIETFKKKFMVKETAKWRIVVWFNEQQWFNISFNDRFGETYLQAEILARAHLPDGKQQIQQLLLEHNIDITQNKTHHLESFIEEKIFENSFYIGA